jgi:hypothetical protein
LPSTRPGECSTEVYGLDTATAYAAGELAGSLPASISRIG